MGFVPPVPQPESLRLLPPDSLTKSALGASRPRGAEAVSPLRGRGRGPLFVFLECSLATLGRPPRGAVLGPDGLRGAASPLLTPVMLIRWARSRIKTKGTYEGPGDCGAFSGPPASKESTPARGSILHPSGDPQ